MEWIVQHMKWMKVVHIIGPWGSCVRNECGDELVVFVPMEKDRKSFDEKIHQVVTDNYH